MQTYNISNPNLLKPLLIIPAYPTIFDKFIDRHYFLASISYGGLKEFCLTTLNSEYEWDFYYPLFFYFMCYPEEFVGFLFMSGYFYMPYYFPLSAQSSLVPPPLIPIVGSLNGIYSYSVTYKLPVASVVLDPAEKTITVGEQVQFSVIGYDRNGRIVTNFSAEDQVTYGTPTWQCNGGSITENGLFTPDKPGDYIVTVTYVGHVTATATATIHVQPPAAVLKQTGIVYEYRLEQNHPNPFNPGTTICYSVKENAHVKLIVYDLTGRTVMTLVDKNQNPGAYQTTFDGRNLPSGIYFCRISMNGFSNVKKMILLE